MKRLAPLLLLLTLLVPSSAFAQEDPASRELLDAIREDLVQLRFEKALAALEPLLTRPGLSEDERVEAWVLGSQIHAALGNFKTAEEDYRQILLRRPGWSPDRSLTPKKAMQRFESVRDALIGRVRFVLDPADATLSIDGIERPETLDPLPLTAGTHTVRAARRGHDPVEQTLEVGAGQDVDFEIALIPNARTVILRTEPANVEVRLDGRVVGRTKRVDEFIGVGQAPAQLVLEDIPLGEHTFEFRMECRRTEKIVDALNIDLLDRAPKRYDTVRLAESFVLLTPVGGPHGTELRVDGRAVATLPAESVQACPGERTLQAVQADRVVWMERRTLVEGVPQRLEIRARPNLVLVGLKRIPRELAGLASSVNVVRAVDAAPGDDFSRVATWNRMNLDRGTDLVLAPDVRRGRGAGSSWWLYSPVLRTLHRVTDTPDAKEPAWRTLTWGLSVVDADGPLVVEQFESAKGGPDVGSRILGVDGQPVASVAEWQARLARAQDRGAIEIEWRRADGETVKGKLRATRGPWLRDRGDQGVEDAFRAAWAVVASAAADGAEADAALANLALLFGAHGEHDLAARTWRRVDWPERNGVGAGTAAYYLGRELQALGRDREAVKALRLAAASPGRAGKHTGPPVAPAARDRLADLGEGR